VGDKAVMLRQRVQQLHKESGYRQGREERRAWYEEGELGRAAVHQLGISYDQLAARGQKIRYIDD
jgi:hypothetical protein